MMSLSKDKQVDIIEALHPYLVFNTISRYLDF